MFALIDGRTEAGGLYRVIAMSESQQSLEKIKAVDEIVVPITEPCE